MDKKIIIFDLDDTLVNHRMKIPRQTYHMLNKFKKAGYLIGVISYNFLVNLVAKETNLYKYTTHVYYGKLDRDQLFKKCISNMIEEITSSFEYEIYYVDDRKDNLECVKQNFTNVNTYHCKNMYELYKFKHTIKK